MRPPHRILFFAFPAGPFRDGYFSKSWTSSLYSSCWDMNGRGVRGWQPSFSSIRAGEGLAQGWAHNDTLARSHEERPALIPMPDMDAFVPPVVEEPQ